ncbi:WD40-repeat-containing domain protein [Suillus subalutaceus]|uniref:WD40-repeat-containing domain protein n=1 Tax=Suillus subalutaceus TaxID=48586 RepID=UPI001B86C308|nr:WD40-repeat-containing domain protein [Suillus subalutaceus]KAG1860127.1 WD40-repeat-containing domain protein [Suillus subalutaceus]
MATRFFARGTRKEASTIGQSEKPIQWEEPVLKHEFKGHKEAIWGFVFLHDNIHIVSGSLDGTMRKWNCDTGLVVGEPWEGEGGGIYALALSPDGKIIACGREDGSVQLWNTDGKMIEGVWTSHSRAVRSLSWSPNGSRLASGSDDGTVLIRNTESGKVEVGPIDAKQGGVWSLAYSPSGERIASGGQNETIRIWDTKTGKLVVGPIKGRFDVTSLVWSSDSTKVYTASDRFARVFDGKTGEPLHSFEHDHYLWSIALSPNHNVLACVGFGVAQLWDTESHQQIGQSFHQIYDILYYASVSFSQDGSHLAYGGSDNKLTLWVVKYMPVAPQLPASTLLQQCDRQCVQEETRLNSPLSSCLNIDATGGSGFIEEAHSDPYNNFFQSSQQSLPSPSPGFHIPYLFLARRLRYVISRHHPSDESVPQERSKRGFFSRRTRSNSSLELATC